MLTLHIPNLYLLYNPRGDAPITNPCPNPNPRGEAPNPRGEAPNPRGKAPNPSGGCS